MLITTLNPGRCTGSGAQPAQRNAADQADQHRVAGRGQGGLLARRKPIRAGGQPEQPDAPDRLGLARNDTLTVGARSVLRPVLLGLGLQLGVVSYARPQSHHMQRQRMHGVYGSV